MYVYMSVCKLRILFNDYQVLARENYIQPIDKEVLAKNRTSNGQFVGWFCNNYLILYIDYKSGEIVLY